MGCQIIGFLPFVKSDTTAKHVSVESILFPRVYFSICYANAYSCKSVAFPEILLILLGYEKYREFVNPM